MSIMTTTPEQEGRGAVQETAVRLQQGLLAAGYTYQDGDEVSWPLSPVLLGKGTSFVLVAAWPVHPDLLRNYWDTLRRDAGAAGLLLVGLIDATDPELDHLFEAASGAIVYIDARTGAVRARRVMIGTPEVLSEALLPTLLQPSPDARALDNRTLLGQHLARRRERDRVAAWLTRPAGPPVVTYALIGLCALCFLFMMSAILPAGSHGVDNKLEVALRWGALVPALVRAGEWWRLLAAGFLHVEPWHILLNMVALYNLGYVLEHWQGRLRYAALFLISVLTSSLAVVLFQRGDTVTLGASGGIFGLLGGFCAIAVRYGRDFSPELRQRLFGWIPRVLILNGLISFIPGISLFGHLGGLLGGFLIGLLILRSPARQ